MPDGSRDENGSAAAEREADAADASLLRNVRVNLTLWSGAATLVVLIVLGLVLYLAVARSLAASGIAQLESQATLMTSAISGERPEPGDLPSGGFIFGGRGSGTYSMILDESGQTIGPQAGPVPRGLPDEDGVAAAKATGERDIRESAVRDTPVRVLTEPADWRGRTLYVQVVGDRTTEVQTLQVLLLVLVVGGLAALLVAAGAGAAYARRALVPIRDSLVAQRVALRRQREFAADASHELRTPLTVVRSSVEHLQRHPDRPVGEVGSALEDISAEVEHLTSMVDDLLLLARSDSGAIALERVPVDLGDVAAEGASALSTPAHDRGVTVTVDPRPAVVSGDPSRLRQLVMILVDNAIRHAPSAGSVAVSVRADGAGASLVVEDDGPGIRPEDLSRVFERFYRAKGAPVGGTGLGLSIAAWIVDRHGGRIEVTNRPEGGARFAVTLPLEARPAS